MLRRFTVVFIQQLFENLVRVIIADAAGKLLIRLAVGLYPLFIALCIGGTLIAFLRGLAESGQAPAQHYHAHYRQNYRKHSYKSLMLHL